MRAPILVLDKYEIVEQIATGGMAAVYRATLKGPMGFEKPVAIKVLLDEASKDEEVVRMFIDEARIGARLSHPNLASVLDFGEVEGRYYIALEYVDGLSLAELLKSLGKRRGLDLQAVIYVTHCVLQALDYLHSAKGPDGKPLNLVHRDISPQNILIDRSGAVKVCDLGIATGDFRSEKTKVGYVKGKRGFMSPEQALGELVDCRSDLYSLGLTVIAMLTGTSPLQEKKDATLAAQKGLDPAIIERLDIPDGLKKVLAKALRADREGRFSSAKEFAKALEEAGFPFSEAGKAALISLFQRMPERRAKERKQEAKTVFDVSLRPYKYLLLWIAAILLLSILFALFGVKLL